MSHVNYSQREFEKHMYLYYSHVISKDVKEQMQAKSACLIGFPEAPCG